MSDERPRTSPRWARIEEVFTAALEAGDDRGAVVARECAGDPELAREVESLLAAHAAVGAADRLEQELTRHRRGEEPAPGDRVGRYEILERLGGGGMGAVYAAQDESLGRTVALKLLHRILSVDPDATRRFLLEAQSAAALDHPNICGVHEIAETDDGHLFIAMPLYRGETLLARLARGPLPVADALAVAAGVACGLEHAHGRGIVHRDIKPANLLLLEDGSVKILDFGIAKVADVSLTSSGAILGTIPYMSPEQAAGGTVDHRTDLWSLGVVLYEMIAGRRPFDGPQADAIIAAILTEEPRPLTGAPGTGAASQVLGRLLTKDVAERPASASAARAALEAALDAVQHGPVWEGAEDAPPVSPEGERRHVAVLVTQVGGYAVLVERFAPEELERAVRQIREAGAEVASRHAGVVHRFTGESLVCLFGVPATHEDDVARAVRAARDLHAWSAGAWLGEDVDAPPLHLRSGVCAGTVVVQPDPASRSHRVTGDPLECASRLAAHAEGEEVLVGPECQRPLATGFVLRPGAPLVLPERSTPSTPHVVMNDSASATPIETAERVVLTPFAGRKRELAQLREALTLAHSEGQFVTIEGEAGAGKSRLLHEMGRAMRSGELQMVRVWCRSHGFGAPPYLPFIAALRDTLDLGTAPPQDLDPEVIAARIEEWAPELRTSVPVFLQLLGVPGEWYPVPRHLEGEHFRAAIRNALVALFTLATRRRPAALVLEDWHWADDASRDVLEQLAELVPAYRLALVVSYRPGHDIQWPPATPRKAIQLTPLDAAATAQLIGAVLRADTVPEEMASTIHERAGGNPFFVEELCHALREQGAVAIRDGEAQLARPLDELHLPVTIQGVIRTRLDRVDPAAREVARAASVAGRDFSLALVRQLAGGEVSLPRAIERLKHAGLIHQTQVLPEPAYRFKHVLTQEVIYDTILAHRRRALHAQVGAALEALYPDRRDELASVLSHHFSRADAWREAIRYGREEARQAIALSEFARALRVTEQLEVWARKLSDEDSRRDALVGILLEQERLCETLGRRKRQQEVLSRLLELLEPDGDRETLAEVYRRQGDLHGLLHQFTDAESALDRALALSREVGSAEVERGALTSLGLLHWHAGRSREGLPYVEQALAIDQARGMSDKVAGDLINLSTLLRALGEWNRALAVLDEAWTIAESGIDPRFRAYILYNLGMVHRRKGDHDRALACLREVIEINEQNGMVFEQAFDLSTLAHLQLELGDVEGALDTSREAVAMSRRVRYPDGLAHALRIRGDVLLGLGRGSEALPHFYEAAQVFAQLENHEAEGAIWKRIGALESERGEHRAAANAWTRVRDRCCQAGDASGELEAAGRVARAMRDSGEDPEGARSAFRDALQLAAHLEDLAGEGEMSNAAGILEWRVGNFERALAHYERALAVARELGDRSAEGLALNSIGATLLRLQQLDAARTRLEEAVTLNRETGQALLEGHGLGTLGDVRLALGDVEEAEQCYEASLAIRPRIGDRRGEGWMLHQLARTAHRRGDQERADDLRGEARRIALEIGDDELASACDAPSHAGVEERSESRHPKGENHA